MAPSFQSVKDEINAAIEVIRKSDPALADHLTKRIIFDERKGTIGYFPEPGEETPNVIEFLSRFGYRGVPMYCKTHRSRMVSVGEIVYREFKQPIFDTLIVPERGGSVNVALFSDHKRFPDGTPKEQWKDCNFLLDQQLGFPLQYDLKRLDLHIEKYAHPSDVEMVMKGLKVMFMLGQGQLVLGATAATFAPRLVGSYPELIEDQIAKFAKDGVWRHYTHPVELKLGSTEQFRCEMSGFFGELHGSVHLKVLMQGTLLKPVR